MEAAAVGRPLALRVLRRKGAAAAANVTEVLGDVTTRAAGAQQQQQPVTVPRGVAHLRQQHHAAKLRVNAGRARAQHRLRVVVTAGHNDQATAHATSAAPSSSLTRGRGNYQQ